MESRGFYETLSPKRLFKSILGVDKKYFKKTKHLKIEEKKSFEILVRENSRMLTVFLCSRIKEQAVVDDLFQETMLVAWRRLPDYDLNRPFGPWLRGIAHRVTLAYFRKQSRLPFFMTEKINLLMDKHFNSIDLQSGDNWQDKVDALNECLKGLPEKYRSVINQKYFSHESILSVSEWAGISLEACKKRMQRGRRLLAQCLKTKGTLFSKPT